VVAIKQEDRVAFDLGNGVAFVLGNRVEFVLGNRVAFVLGNRVAFVLVYVTLPDFGDKCPTYRTAEFGYGNPAIIRLLCNVSED
jgi:hypothetical protein